jgi:hypothetical protein
LTQVEEDEELTLLLAMVEEIEDALAPPLTVRSALVEQQQVHLDKTKAHAFLDTTLTANDRLEGWYLDTGVMNHMTDRGKVFSELDRAVQGTVKFEDDFIVNICGKGTIIFFGLYGEHKVFTGVYYIPWLRNSITIIGQMDEGDLCVLNEGGVLKIWDRQRCLLAQVQRNKNWMY